MKTETEHVMEQIVAAKSYEDIFGTVEGNGEQKLNVIATVYKRLARKIHPDVNGNSAAATEAFTRLNQHHEDAKWKVQQGSYGNRAAERSGYRMTEDNTEVLIAGKYVRYANFAVGDMADLHACYAKGKSGRSELLLKVAREPRDQILMEAERTNLKFLEMELGKHAAGTEWRQCIPRVYESLGQATVLERFTGFVDSVKIHQAYPAGVDARTIAWMWKRLLLLLDWTHNLGVLHGAVLPPHVLYFPDNEPTPTKRDARKHAVRLVDWCYSLKNPSVNGKKLKAWVPEWEPFYAPEILAKGPLGPHTDLYMGAKTMQYLLGGDVTTSNFPAHVPLVLAKSFQECLRPDARRRPQNLGLYFDGFTQLLQQLYGPPKFHEFIMPRT